MVDLLFRLSGDARRRRATLAGADELEVESVLMPVLGATAADRRRS